MINGRLDYYWGKLKNEFSEKGIIGSISMIFDFLIKRKFFIQFIIESIEYNLISRFRSYEDTVIKVWKDDLSQESDKILLYASFDLKSEIKDHVIEQLKAFSLIGYKIVYVSTSPFFTSDQLNNVSDFASVVIHRKNIGYDFVSWRCGYEKIKLRMNHIQSLIVMNDSCLGPYCDLGPLVTRMQSANNCVYGNSKSYEITEYIQSYFYHFGESVIESGLHKEFFDRIRILNSKWCIVRFLEIGSSRMFKKNGIPLKALIDPVDPIIKKEMDLSNRTEPMGDPLGKKWVELKLTPFYKRSNLL